MDFPLFHLDFFGNRLLIAVIAIVHVFHSHPLAVGAIPLVTGLEWWGWRNDSRRIDDLARRILFVCFVLTTSVGALTGVGIWLSTALVNPAAIGSLLRVFFWAWFTEWIVFVAEVALILVYFLTWKRMERRKGAHVAIGAALAVFSWLTMAIITAILGFMMDPGSWVDRPGLLTGVFNPLYLPQLAFRTPLAMAIAGTFALLLTFFFAEGDTRRRAVRWISIWTAAWVPALVAGSIWYWREIPGWMLDQVPVAVLTQQYAGWYGTVGPLIAAAAAAVALACLWGIALPRRLPRAVLLVPFALSLVLFATFERVREFIRKPYVIGGYMYANGIRQEDYPLLREEGVLPHATFATVHEIRDDNRAEAGRDLFLLACSRCHTTAGINGLTGRLEAMYGPPPWEPAAIRSYLGTLHRARPFMPPFPGSDEEAGVLADYLSGLGRGSFPRDGAQSEGTPAPPADRGGGSAS